MYYVYDKIYKKGELEMKKIFCILVLSAFCLAGCQNNKTEETAETADFTRKLEAGNLKEDSFEKELGKPDKENENEMMYKFTWNDYELVDSFHGLLELGCGKKDDWIPCWRWTSAGTKESFLNLYNVLVGIYGKPKHTSEDGVNISFPFKDDVLSSGYNGYVKYCDDHGLEMSIFLGYDEESNMITVVWPNARSRS